MVLDDHRFAHEQKSFSELRMYCSKPDSYLSPLTTSSWVFRVSVKQCRFSGQPRCHLWFLAFFHPVSDHSPDVCHQSVVRTLKNIRNPVTDHHFHCCVSDPGPLRVLPVLLQKPPTVDLPVPACGLLQSVLNTAHRAVRLKCVILCHHLDENPPLTSHLNQKKS